MKLVLRNGEIKEVDTKYVFNNQYNTVDGKRVYDVDVQRIIDDVRLGEFYCSSVKQGTYQEVKEAIEKERSQINNCRNCFWFTKHERIEPKCSRHKEFEDGIETITEVTTYKISCAYSKGCAHDINETPKLFRDVQECFFCKYIDGVPDQTKFKKFLIKNAEKFSVIYNNPDGCFKINAKFGSYEVYSNGFNNPFVIRNARHHYKFYVDFDNKKLILDNGIGYTVTDKLYETKYNYEKRKSERLPIKNYDKFAKWLWDAVDEFVKNKGE